MKKCVNQEKITQMTFCWKKNEIKESKMKILVFNSFFPTLTKGQSHKPDILVKDGIRRMESYSKVHLDCLKLCLFKWNKTMSQTV